MHSYKARHVLLWQFGELKTPDFFCGDCSWSNMALSNGGGTVSDVTRILQILERGLVLTRFSTRRRPEKRSFQVKLETRQLIWVRVAGRREGVGKCQNHSISLKFQELSTFTDFALVNCQKGFWQHWSRLVWGLVKCTSQSLSIVQGHWASAWYCGCGVETIDSLIS